MATDVREHTVPASTDHPSRAALLALALSIRDPIPVANATARATKLTNLAAAGITPSTSTPIAFWRADAGAGRELEVTDNGTTFWTVGVFGAWTTITLDSGIAAASGYPAPAWRLENGGSQLRIRGTRLQYASPLAVTTSGGVDYALASGANALAAAARPSQILYHPINYYSGTIPQHGMIKLQVDGTLNWRPSSTISVSLVEFGDLVWQLP